MSRRRFGRQTIFTFTTGGVKVEIDVDGDGVFSTSLGGEYLRADTLKEVVAQARKLAKRTRIQVAVPATAVGVHASRGHGYYRKGVGDTCIPILLTGLDGNGEIQWKIDRVNAPMVDSIRTNLDRDDEFVYIAKPLTKADMQTYDTLVTAYHEAHDAVYEFKKQHELDAKTAVKDALATLIDTPTMAAEPLEDQR